MSAVPVMREELVNLIAQVLGEEYDLWPFQQAEYVAQAITERFNVTLKTGAVEGEVDG